MDTDQIIAAAPFTGTLGITFTKLDAEEVRAEVALTHALSTIGGGLHGGVLMSLADISATVCSILNAPEGALTTTAQSTSYLLRPIHGTATAVARPLRAGKRSIVIEVDLLDAEGSVCGRTTQIQTVLAAQSQA